MATVARGLGVDALRSPGRAARAAAVSSRWWAALGALGFSDLGMTTNGMLFAPVAAPLAAAGLRRVNISCDSLRPERFALDSPSRVIWPRPLEAMTTPRRPPASGR